MSRSRIGELSDKVREACNNVSWKIATPLLITPLLGEVVNTYVSNLVHKQHDVPFGVAGDYVQLAMSYAVIIPIGLYGSYITSQLTQVANKDPLTSCYSQGYYIRNIDNIVKRSQEKNQNLGVVVIDMNNIKLLNDTHGHDRGNKAIASFARLLNQTIKDDDYAIRLGGDEFLLLLSNAEESTGDLVIHRLNDKLDIFNQHNNRDINYDIEFSSGHELMRPGVADSIHSFIKIADDKMYQDKKLQKTPR